MKPSFSAAPTPITFCAQYIAENPLLLPLEELIQVARQNETLRDTEKKSLEEAHLYALCKSSEKDPNKEEILYIAQCFGTNGENDILKRLNTDPELVEMIERAKESWPQDIFSILFFPFSHEPYLLPASHIKEEEIQQTPELYHKLEKIQRLQVPVRRKTDILEAALIGHFSPLYNKEYPKKFSSSLAKLLEKFSHASISAILIEFSTENLDIEFFSQAQISEKHVLLPFDISSKISRQAFLALEKQ